MSETLEFTPQASGQWSLPKHTVTPPMVRAFVDPVFGITGKPLEFSRADCRTLADVVARVPLAPELEVLRPMLRVKMEGELIAPEKYRLIIPKQTTFLTVVLPVHGDGNLLQTIAVVALIGASLFVGGFGVPFLGTAFAAGSVGANLVAAGLSLAASMLLQGLNAPKAGDTTDREEVGVASAQNAFEPGAYLPRVAGRRRIAPPMVMPPYTDIDGKDQLVTAVYGLSGPHAGSQIRIGDSDIAGATDITYEIREGFAGDAPLTLVTKTVIEKAFNLQLSEFKTKTNSGDGNVVDTSAPIFNPFWHRVETKKGPDIARLMFTLPQGIGNTLGSNQSTYTSMRLRIRKKGTVTWTNLPEFLIKGRMAAQVLRLQLEIKWVAYASMPVSSTAFPSGFGAAGGRGWASKINRWPTSGTLRWAADTYFTTMFTHAVNYVDGQRIEVYLDTTAYPQDAAYEIELIRGFSGKSADVDVAAATYSGHNDFYTSRASGGDQIIPYDPAEQFSPIVLSSVQSIWDEYPFDLTGQPTFLLAITARNRSLDQVNLIAEGYTEDWDGSAWVPDQLTRNPASWDREALRSQFNAEPVPDSLLEDAELVDWHEWNTANGHKLDAIFQGQSVSEVRGIAAQAGFARPRFGVKHGVIVDRPRSGPVGAITQRNAWGFSFQKPFGRLPHALKVQLTDEDDDYKVRELIVYADGYAAVAGGGLLEATRFETVSYPGITSADRATKRATRDMRWSRHRSTLLSFSMDIEQLQYSIGEEVMLETDILGQIGGRGRVMEVLLSGSNVTGLVLDEQRDFTRADATSADRGAMIRLSDGSLITHEVTGDDTDLNTIVFATPFPMPLDGLGAPMIRGSDVDNGGSLVVTGDLLQVARPVLLWDMTAGPDLTCKIVAIDYAAAQIYEAAELYEPEPLLDKLTTLGITGGLKLALDSGDIASWPGTGDKWLDTSGGGYDWFLGTGAGAQSSDPTFTGTAGDLGSGEYWALDGGDFFTYDGANEAWMENIHKANAKVAVAMWVQLADNVSRRLGGTRNASSTVGYVIATDSTGHFRLVVSNGSADIATVASPNVMPTGQWCFVAFTLDFAAGTGAFVEDGVVTAASPSFGGTPSAGAAGQVMRLMAAGGSSSNLPPAGSRVAAVAMWEGTVPSSADLVDLYDATKGRFGL